MISWVKTAIEFFTNPIADLTGGYRERAKIAAESASLIAKAEVSYKVAEFQAKEKRLLVEHETDADYDTKVLNNRNLTYADEFLIITWIGLFLAHFIPKLQPFMAGGWKAMGYTQVPWWFEFGMVGILVSTLGLMRLFKLLLTMWKGGRINVNNQQGN